MRVTSKIKKLVRPKLGVLYAARNRLRREGGTGQQPQKLFVQIHCLDAWNGADAETLPSTDRLPGHKGRKDENAFCDLGGSHLA